MKVLYCIHPAKKRDEKPAFRRVGVGFVNSDNSINVLLDAQPGITYQLRETTDKEDNS